MNRALDISPAMVRRVKAGEAVSKIAREEGITTPWGYKRLLTALHKKHKIEPLKRGRRPISPFRSEAVNAFSQHFDNDETHWPGAADEWRKLRPYLTLITLGKRFGYNSRQRAKQIDFKLTGGKKKPPVREKPAPLLRPDVAAGKILSLVIRGYHLSKIAKLLQTSNETVRRRMRDSNISIPKYAHPLNRPDINPECVRKAAQSCRSILEMSKKLRTSHMTIHRRAERYRIPLPDGRLSMKA